MEDSAKQVSEVALYLQRLAEPSIFSEVQEAVSRKDNASFAKVCKKAKIPQRYIATLAGIMLSTQILVTWPPG